MGLALGQTNYSSQLSTGLDGAGGPIVAADWNGDGKQDLAFAVQQNGRYSCIWATAPAGSDQRTWTLHWDSHRWPWQLRIWMETAKKIWWSCAGRTAKEP